MAVNKYYVQNKKEGFLYDKQKKRYFSWGYDIYIGGVRVQERGFLTKDLATQAVAKKKLDQKLARHGIRRENEPVYLANLFQKQLTRYSGRDRTRAKRIYEEFLAILPERFSVSQLKTAHLQQFIQKKMSQMTGRTGGALKNSSIKREFSHIVVALNSAYLFFESLEDYRPPRIPRIVVSQTRKERVITHDERRAIFKAFYAPQKPDESLRSYNTRIRVGQFFQTMLLTVSRPGEIAALKISDIDLDAEKVLIRGTKTRFKSAVTVRSLPITASLKKIFLDRIEYARRINRPFIFTQSGFVTPPFYEKLKEACKAAGVPYGEDDPEGITFHTARHTGTTVLSRSNKIDTKNIGAFTGHSDQTMTLYYTHASNQTVSVGAEVLEENFGEILATGEILESK